MRQRLLYGREFVPVSLGGPLRKANHRMNKEERGSKCETSIAEKKFAELTSMLDAAQSTVSSLVNDIAAEHHAPRELAPLLSQLNKLFFNFVEAEEKLNDEFGAILRAGEIDLDEARDRIGRRLDNIRKARSAGGVPE